jgi:hypothetical protein
MGFWKNVALAFYRFDPPLGYSRGDDMFWQDFPYCAYCHDAMSFEVGGFYDTITRLSFSHRECVQAFRMGWRLIDGQRMHVNSLSVVDRYYNVRGRCSSVHGRNFYYIHDSGIPDRLHCAYCDSEMRYGATTVKDPCFGHLFCSFSHWSAFNKGLVFAVERSVRARQYGYTDRIKRCEICGEILHFPERPDLENQYARDGRCIGCATRYSGLKRSS